MLKRDSFLEATEVFSASAPGFDAVIGNPPYIRIQALREWAPIEVDYYKDAYKAASKGNYDIYVVFVERALSLLNAKGQVGFILPHKFFNAQYGEPLRAQLARGKYVSEIVHFGYQQVFDQATTYTCLLFLDKTGNQNSRVVKVDDLLAWRNSGQAVEGIVPADAITEHDWNFAVGEGSELLDKLHSWPTKLGEIARIFQGLITGADKVFVLEEISQNNDGCIIVRDQDGHEWTLEQRILKPFINDITVATYQKPNYHHRIIFPYQLTADNRAELIPVVTMASDYPKIWSYLHSKEQVLKDRESGAWNNPQWYALGRTQNLTQMDDPKLIVQVISRSGRYAYDQEGIYFTGGGNGPYYGVRWSDPNNPHTSKLLDLCLHNISSPFRGGYWSYGKRFIEQLPIRIINFRDPADKTRHDRVVALAQQMVSLHKRLAEARTPQDTTVIQQQIGIVDQQINNAVYELYNLTPQEIEIVERQTQNDASVLSVS